MVNESNAWVFLRSGTWLIALIIATQVCTAVAAPATAGQIALREATIGDRIAQGEQYDLYAFQVKAEGGALVCDPTLVINARKPEAERKQQVNQAFVAMRKESGRIHQYHAQRNLALSPEMSALHEAYPQRGPAYEVALQELTARKTQIVKEGEAETRLLALAHWQDERTTMGELVIYVLHRTNDINAPIVPTSNYRPIPEFVRGLADKARPFLRTCPDLDTVYVYHVWMDYYKSQGSDHVVNYPYVVRAGELELAPQPRGTPWPQQIPERNAFFTVAGLLAREEYLNIKSGAYRDAYRTAAGRQPGIVYKYELWWQTTGLSRLARRVFEGQFHDLQGSDGMMAYYIGLAEAQTRYCSRKSEIETRRYKTRCLVGQHERADGTLVFEYAECEMEHKLDGRFMDKWLEFQGPVAVLKAVRAKNAVRLSQRRGTSLTNADLKRMWNEMGWMRETEQMSTLVQAEGCTSPVVEQMRRNFQRIARGQPSLQDAGVLIPGAEQASDPVLSKEDRAAKPVAHDPIASPPPALPEEPAERVAADETTGGIQEAPVVPAPGPAPSPKSIPTPSPVPSSTSSPAVERPTAASPRKEPSVADRTKMKQELQLVANDFLAEQQRQFGDFMERLRQATNPEERAEIQRQLQQSQKSGREELQKRIEAIHAKYE